MEKKEYRNKIKQNANKSMNNGEQNYYDIYSDSDNDSSEKSNSDISDWSDNDENDDDDDDDAFSKNNKQKNNKQKNNKQKNKYIKINSRYIIIKRNIKKQINGIELKMFKKFASTEHVYDKIKMHKNFYSVIPKLVTKYKPKDKEKIEYLYNIIMNILFNLETNIIKNTNAECILEMWELYE